MRHPASPDGPACVLRGAAVTAIPGGSRTMSRGGGKACQKPWEAATITPHERNEHLLRVSREPGPYLGFLLVESHRVFTTVL